MCGILYLCCYVFVFKQKTAYEMRISDWSSDVCSSDLGTQFSCSYALAGLFEAEALFRAALVTGALSTEAAKGSDTPFDPRIHALRGHKGQIETADALRGLMAGSAIRSSHVTGDARVQDPYCLRCQQIGRAHV